MKALVVKCYLSYLDPAQTVDDVLGVLGGVRSGQTVAVVTAGVAG